MKSITRLLIAAGLISGLAFTQTTQAAQVTDTNAPSATHERGDKTHATSATDVTNKSLENNMHTGLQAGGPNAPGNTPMQTNGSHNIIPRDPGIIGYNNSLNSSPPPLTAYGVSTE